MQCRRGELNPFPNERGTMRALISIALVVVSPGASLVAQGLTPLGETSRLCLRAQPKPDCSGFALTNAGVYVVLGGNSGGETAARGVFDYGFLINLNTRDAVGRVRVRGRREARPAARPGDNRGTTRGFGIWRRAVTVTQLVVRQCRGQDSNLHGSCLPRDFKRQCRAT